MRALLLLLYLIAACDRPTPDLGDGSRKLGFVPPKSDIRVSENRPLNPDAALMLTEPGLLAELEAQGLALHRVLRAPDAAASSLHAASAIYRDFAQLVSLDDSVAKERDPNAKAAFSASHRLFDIRWLKSTRTRFELIGVVNRADRVFATPGESCGELRLIYRLAYATPRVSSRLPMTLGLVFSQGSGDDAQACKDTAQRWLELERFDAKGESKQLAAAALDGPLHALSSDTLRRVETNFQSGRWPSAVRPALGGHAEYVLRSFDVVSYRLVLSTLENTPTQKLAASGRAALNQWIADNFSAIDTGTALLPAALRAERSVSVQPHGAARLASRAFTQIAAGFSDATLFEGAYQQSELIHSRAGLMRRLDQLTCKGCHATRSLAGFHLLGEDSAATSPFNAIAVGLSPHLLAELPWRRAFLEALARGERYEQPRPYADRGAITEGRLGDACGLGDPTFESWTCGAGLTCKDRVGDLVGTCASSEGNALGDAVELGKITQDRTALRDTLRLTTLEPCAPLADGTAPKTARSSDGFPAGMCHAPCSGFGERSGDAICGPLPFGKGTEFDGITKCLTQHDQPFDTCLADDAHPTWLKRCDRSTPCRDDYLCVRIPNAPTQDGACVPPYFLFQIRVDGHFVERD